MQFNPHDIIELNGSKFEVRPNLIKDDNFVFIMELDGEKTCQELTKINKRGYSKHTEIWDKQRLIKAIQIEPKVQDEIDRLSDIDEPMRYESPENSEF